MQKILHINPDKCTGCLQCEMACSFENYGTYAPAKSRIKVFDFHETGRKADRDHVPVPEFLPATGDKAQVVRFGQRFAVLTAGREHRHATGQRAHPAKHALVGPLDQPQPPLALDPASDAMVPRLGLLRRLDRHRWKLLPGVL